MLQRSVWCWFLFIGTVLGQEQPKVLSPEDAKTAFLKLLDRPKVPLEPKAIQPPQESKGTIVEHFSIATQKNLDGKLERMPTLLVKPKRDGKLPVMIVLHGTGGTKEGQRNWLDDFAAKGIIGVAIDARYHGERSGGAKGSEAYVAAITKAWRTPAGQPHEHPFYYDTVWDLWRLVDYLQTRPDVDPDQIGMLGISMGGIQTYLAAAIDARVKVAAPLIAVQSFQWSLANERWQGRARTIQATHQAAANDLGEKEVNAKVCRTLWNKIIPGIVDHYDCPNLLPLFADRALFIANGTKDPNCPIEGAKIAIDRAEQAFAKGKRKDHLEVLIEEVAHTVTPKARAAAIQFCVRHLQK